MKYDNNITSKTINILLGSIIMTKDSHLYSDIFGDLYSDIFGDLDINLDQLSIEIYCNL